MRVLLVFLFMVAGLGEAAAANLKLLTAGAFKPIILELVPAFEKETGHKVTVVNDTAGGLTKRISSGEAFDVIVLTANGLEDAAVASRLTNDPPVQLIKVGVGVASRLSGPTPNINGVESFRRTLLDAKAVAYIDPASGGTSGIYIANLFRRLGIANEMKAKSVLVRGGLAAERVARGDADIALQQASELRVVPGVRFVGMLPEQIQNYTIYAGAIGAGAKDMDAAGALLTALSGAPLALLKRKGMDLP